MVGDWSARFGVVLDYHVLSQSFDEFELHGDGFGVAVDEGGADARGARRCGCGGLMERGEERVGAGEGLWVGKDV